MILVTRLWIGDLEDSRDNFADQEPEAKSAFSCRQMNFCPMLTIIAYWVWKRI